MVVPHHDVTINIGEDNLAVIIISVSVTLQYHLYSTHSFIHVCSAHKIICPPTQPLADWFERLNDASISGSFIDEQHSRLATR